MPADNSGTTGGGAGDAAYTMPSERTPHERTFMAWPAGAPYWEELIPGVRADIARIARAIADFEPVTMLARPEQADDARRACGSGVEVLPLPVDDLWVRDSGPTFVHGSDGLVGIDFGFNGWGGKQDHDDDGAVARRLLEEIGVPRVRASIVGEGGAIEIDGEGTLMATESSWVNPNRNPGMSRDEIEAELRRVLGVRTVVWLAGVAGADVTDAHIDSLARFARPGVVLLNRSVPDASDEVWTRCEDEAFAVLSEAADAEGRRPDVIDLPEADPRRIGDVGEAFLPSYINYYVANGAVVMPAFGDREADDRAAGIIGDLHADREVRQVRIDSLAEGGGGIHCSTQQLPVSDR
ncbi:agmatine deiminase [Nocardiopsis mwathae]|uniref:Agmatine deiminase n=1 Tax=Nocardiopsis mwathae TaxID=1472723 RepID=A0A7W9YKE1_9ACTN|nr:agmatine deiminase family protein [Nocardiopsis mwathae]MBB6173799.1 agmatine deiminase [Nocardiopsis mwathae]